MPLTNVYVQTYGQLADFFRTLQQGQAPTQFTVQHLKDLGFTSSNHRALIPLLKTLGFLSGDGQPLQRYHDYRDASQGRKVLGQALKEAYSDLFVLRANPTDGDKGVIQGKFKSTHNTSDNVSELMTKTFYALLALADIGDPPATTALVPIPEPAQSDSANPPARTKRVEEDQAKLVSTSLNYNIQIHLPATKDIEVFNAIFKSLREHLVD
jgi:uncharacterized protein DUF5343